MKLGLHHKIAKLFGYSLIRNKKNHFDLFLHTMNLIKLKGINAVIDVGANVGQYGKTLRRYGYHGYLFSFEPVKEAFQELEIASRLDNKWIIFNFALGDEN